MKRKVQNHVLFVHTRGGSLLSLFCFLFNSISFPIAEGWCLPALGWELHFRLVQLQTGKQFRRGSGTVGRWGRQSGRGRNGVRNWKKRTVNVIRTQQKENRKRVACMSRTCAMILKFQSFRCNFAGVYLSVPAVFFALKPPICNVGGEGYGEWAQIPGSITSVLSAILTDRTQEFDIIFILIFDVTVH